jgi:GNAT superfamily N-acetyltransferase
MEIRRAKPDEAYILTGIAMRSKAFWGYNDAFMDACRASLTVTQKKITSHHVYLAREGPSVAGFYSLISEGETGVLDHMFVDPPFIDKGVGRFLWDHMTALARKLAIREISVDADPNAEGFYLKMGASRIGEAESSAIPGRMLPLMKVIL